MIACVRVLCVRASVLCFFTQVQFRSLLANGGHWLEDLVFVSLSAVNNIEFVCCPYCFAFYFVCIMVLLT